MKTAGVLIPIFSLLLCLGCSTPQSHSAMLGDSNFRHGRAEAKKDIAAKHMCLKAYGLPQPATEQYAALLQKEMHITYQQIGGTIVSRSLIKYTNDYNAVILAYVAKKYGPRATLDLWDRANAEYNAQMKAQANVAPPVNESAHISND